MSLTSAPPAEQYSQPLWNGTQMLVLNGITGTAAAYEPCANVWQALPSSGMQRYAPPILVNEGLLYFETAPASGGWVSRLTLLDLVAKEWRPLPSDSVSPNQKRAVVWTGKQLIWWGGALQHPDLAGSAYWEDRNDGAIYEFATGQWRAISNANAPKGRKIEGNAVWTGSKLVVWGGQSAVDPSADTMPSYCYNGDYQQCARFDDGAVYDLATDSWSAITSDGAPSRRQGHLMAWTGRDVLVIGGFDYPSIDSWTRLADAYRYSVADDLWSAITLPSKLHDALLNAAPDTRPFEWTGSRLLLSVSASPTYVYDPFADSWQVAADPPNGASCPPARTQGVCTDANGGRYYGLYDAEKNVWKLFDYPVRDTTLRATSTVFTGSQLLEWGGFRLGAAPPPGGCPSGVGCDPIGAPMLYTNEGSVYTPTP